MKRENRAILRVTAVRPSNPTHTEHHSARLCLQTATVTAHCPSGNSIYQELFAGKEMRNHSDHLGVWLKSFLPLAFSSSLPWLNSFNSFRMQEVSASPSDDKKDFYHRSKSIQSLLV